MKTLVLLMLCCVAATLAQSPRLRLINFLRERNINRGVNQKFYNALEEFFTEELTGGNPGGNDGGNDGGSDGGSDPFGLGDATMEAQIMEATEATEGTPITALCALEVR